MKTLLKKYKIFLQKRGICESSIEYYIRYITRFIEYTSPSLSDFEKKKKFDDKYTLLFNRDIKNETRKKYLKCARIFADFLISEKLIKKNAPRKIDNPRVQSPLPFALEDEEIQEIYRVIKTRWSGFLQYRNMLIIDMLLYTGIRRSELINLTRDNIHNEFIFIKNGKGGKDRTVYLPRELSQRTALWMNQTHGVSQYLFYSIRYNPLSERALARIFEEIKKSTKLQKFSPHIMRHTYATCSLEQGVDIGVIKSQLGHASISTTNRYIAVRDKHRREAVQNLQF